jgi:uncharacterized protein YjdB
MRRWLSALVLACFGLTTVGAQAQVVYSYISKTQIGSDRAGTCYATIPAGYSVTSFTRVIGSCGTPPSNPTPTPAPGHSASPTTAPTTNPGSGGAYSGGALNGVTGLTFVNPSSCGTTSQPLPPGSDLTGCTAGYLVMAAGISTDSWTYSGYTGPPVVFVTAIADPTHNIGFVAAPSSSGFSLQSVALSTGAISTTDTAVVSYLILGNSGGGSATAITLNPSTLSLNVGATNYITATQGTNSSFQVRSDSSNATVSVSGNTIAVTGVSPGGANVIVTGQGQSATASVTVGAPVVANTNSVSIAVGATIPVTTTQVGNSTFTPTTDDATVATASTSGGVTTILGVAVGSTTIHITGAAGHATAVAVTVSAAAVSPVALSSSTLSLAAGTSTTVNATQAGNTTFVPTSADPSKVTVSAVLGVVTVNAIAATSTPVVVTVAGANGASATFSVSSTASALVLSPATPISVLATQSTSISVSQVGNASSFSVSTASSSIATATYSAGRIVVLGVGVGTTTLSVTGAFGQSASLAITVGAAPAASAIVLAPSTQTVFAGATGTIAITYTGSGTLGVSSNSANVTVSLTGNTVNFLAVNPTGGTPATISVSDGTITTTATVAVNPNPIQLTPSSISVVAGQTGTFAAQQTANTTFTATSSDTTKATVAVSGANIVVTGVAAGSATITVSGGGTTATGAVTISPAAPNPIVPTATTLSVPAGRVASFNVSQTGNTTFTATSSSIGIATVAVSGSTINVTGVTVGSINITVSGGGTSVVVATTVTPGMVTLSSSTVTVVAGAQTSVAASQIGNTSSPTYSASSSDASVSVTTSGANIVVTGVSPNSSAAIVTVTGLNSVVAHLNVNVTAANISSTTTAVSVVAGSSGSLSATQTGNPGSYTADTSNHAIATASIATQTASGVSINYVGVSVGNTNLTITGQGLSLVIPVTVTAAAISVNSPLAISVATGANVIVTATEPGNSSFGAQSADTTKVTTGVSGGQITITGVAQTTSPVNVAITGATGSAAVNIAVSVVGNTVPIPSPSASAGSAELMLRSQSPAFLGVGKEASGTTLVDASTNALNGTYGSAITHGPAIVANPPSGTNYAPVYPVTTGTPTPNNEATGAFNALLQPALNVTLFAVIKPTSNPANTYVDDYAFQNQAPYSIFIQTSGVPSCIFRGLSAGGATVAASVLAPTNYVLQTNTVYSIACATNGTTSWLVLNGQLVATSTAATPLASLNYGTTTRGLAIAGTIGAAATPAPGLSANFPGVISHLAIFPAYIAPPANLNDSTSYWCSLQNAIVGSAAGTICNAPTSTSTPTPQPTGQATPTAQPTGSGYTGASTEQALLTTFQSVASAAGVGSSALCWPMNDTVGVGYAFVNQCTTTSNDLLFTDSAGNPNDNGFQAADSLPKLVSANDASSVDFTAQTFPIHTTNGILSGTAPWTVGFAFNTPAETVSQSLINTGAAFNGAGFQVYLTTTGHIVAAWGNGGSSYTSVTSTNAYAINTSHVVFVTWAPTQGSTSGGGTANLYIDSAAAQPLTVPAYVATSNNLGVAYPYTTGVGTAAYAGNFSWLTDFPATLTGSQVGTLVTAMTGTVPVVSSTPAPGPSTHLASTFAGSTGFDAEFYGYSNVGESYAQETGVRDLLFMGASSLRSGPSQSTGANPPFPTFCADGIGFSSGFQPLTNGTGPPSTSPALLTVATVTTDLDNIKTAQGCYPLWVEPGNEMDNYKDAGQYGNGYGYDDPDPNHSDVPRWAGYVVQEMHTLRAAIASNSKYAGINVYGPGLANASNYPVLSQAQHDYYGNTLFPVDYSIQHTGLIHTNAAPDGVNGITATQVAKIYVPDSAGFSGYAPPGSAGYVPQIWDEFGESQPSVYNASGNAVDGPLATHYTPRYMLTMADSGLSGPNDWDFLFDKPLFVVQNPFGQVGFVDVLGNVKPNGYAMANLTHLLGYGNSGTRTTPAQLPFSVTVAGGSTAPSPLAEHAFQADDGSYWISLNNSSEEGTAYTGALAATFNGKSGLGLTEAFVGFTSVNLSGLPTSIKTAAVYQNDEYCNSTHTQESTPFGTPLRSYPAGANTDCFQWWPAGSLGNSIQSSYYTVTNGTVMNGSSPAIIKYNGMPLLIHLGASQLAPIPTMTPLPYVAASTPAPSGAAPTVGPTLLPTPVPSFAPPSGAVPTPPAVSTSSAVAPVVLSKTSDSLTVPTAATYGITQTGFSGGYTVTGNTNTSVVSTSISGATLTVTPLAYGTAIVTVSGNGGGASATLSLTVSSSAISISPTSATLTAGGSAATFAITQPGYSGGYTVVSNSNTSAVSTSITGATLTVTPLAAGSANIVIGGNGQTFSLRYRAPPKGKK